MIESFPYEIDQIPLIDAFIGFIKKRTQTQTGNCCVRFTEFAAMIRSWLHLMNGMLKSPKPFPDRTNYLIY